MARSQDEEFLDFNAYALKRRAALEDFLRNGTIPLIHPEKFWAMTSPLPEGLNVNPL